MTSLIGKRVIFTGESNIHIVDMNGKYVKLDNRRGTVCRMMGYFSQVEWDIRPDNQLGSMALSKSIVNPTQYDLKVWKESWVLTSDLVLEQTYTLQGYTMSGKKL